MASPSTPPATTSLGFIRIGQINPMESSSKPSSPAQASWVINLPHGPQGLVSTLLSSILEGKAGDRQGNQTPPHIALSDLTDPWPLPVTCSRFFLEGRAP